MLLIIMSLLLIISFAILRNIPYIHINSLVFNQILLMARYVLLIDAREVYGRFYLLAWIFLRRYVLIFIVIFVA